MAMIIRSDHDLPTLRILIDPMLRTNDVVFQAVRGRGTPTEVARCPITALGLPESLVGADPGSLQDHRLQLPGEVLSRLTAAVDGLGESPIPPHHALWLELPSPRGFVYVAPWERLLEPLGRCLFRLPNHLVRPEAPGQGLEVAICSSAPQAKMAFGPPDIMVRLAEQYLERSGHAVRLHLFTDVAWHPELLARVGDHATLPGHVVIHDPAEAESYERPARTARLSSSAEVSNPWLRWILDSVSGGRIDVMHFVTHGFLSGDRGAIAVASTPTLNTDRHMSRFIGSVEITAFLTRLGAWGLMLSGPPHNFSPAGLREVADAVAQVLPGIALVHDADHDPDGVQLGLALHTIFGAGPELDRPLPAVTAWAHPRFVEFPTEDQSGLHVNADGSSAFIAEATRDALANPDTQPWVASMSRCLEQLQVRWLPDTAEEEADPAAVAALRSVSDMLERHVARAYPAEDTSRGDS